MPNVTISVPEELKAEMDKLSEVSWSEICRNAISAYIAQRKRPTPNIELSLDGAALEHEDFQTGYPTLRIDLRIHNRMNCEIMLDRIIGVVDFTHQTLHVPAGLGYNLHKQVIGSNSTGHTQIRVVLLREKLESLASKFTKTFHCKVHCTVFIEGFKSRYDQEFTTRIPIDEWKEVTARVLKMY
jgi:hypothetical protein